MTIYINSKEVALLLTYKSERSDWKFGLEEKDF